ncbi:MAG: TOBE domain-containing protein, partial [Pseudomonadota bacterium]
ASVTLGESDFEVPRQHAGASGDLVFGVRPEHVRLSDSGGYRGRVLAAEYLGTTQIITLDTPNGDLKARVPSDQVAKVGETVALGFDPKTITLFDKSNGQALRSDLNAGVLNNG